MFNLTDFSRIAGDSDDEVDPTSEVPQVFDTNKYTVEGEDITLREYAFSPTNSGCVWKSSFPLCEYIHKNESLFRNKRILELGSGTGITSIYLRKQGFDVTSSDVTDEDTTQNIKYNCELNNVPHCHVPHFWGSGFPAELNNFDVVIASDIILYENHYPGLLRTLTEVMSIKRDESFFVMTYKRKAYGEKKFFVMLEENGFMHQMIGSKMWRIWLKSNNNNKLES